MYLIRVLERREAAVAEGVRVLVHGPMGRGLNTRFKSVSVESSAPLKSNGCMNLASWVCSFIPWHD